MFQLKNLHYRNKTLLFLMVIIPFKAYTQPLFQVGGNIWEPTLPLYVANCEGEIVSKPLTLVKTPTGIFLDLVFVGAPVSRYLKAASLNYSSYQNSCKGRKAVLYGWVKDPTLKQSQLHQLDATTLKILQSFPFPVDCEEGQLNVFDLTIKGRWHTYLVTLGGGKSWVFDITVPEVALKPVAELEAVEAFSGVRLQNGVWGGCYAKKDGTRSTIQIINFEDFKSILSIPLATGSSLVSLKAIDLEAKGQVDWLFGIDKQGQVWSCDMRDLQSIKVEKLKFQLPLASLKEPFCVLKDSHYPGLWAYFNVKPETDTHEVVGIFQTLSRGGSLPLETEQRLKTKGHKLIGVRSNRLFWVNASLASKWAHSLLLWDPHHAEHVLVALDKECKLNIVSKPVAPTTITEQHLSFRLIDLE